MTRKIIAVCLEDEIFDWRYCPMCGTEILEYCPGDFTAHIICSSDDCDSVDFYLAEETTFGIKSLHPGKESLFQEDDE